VSPESATTHYPERRSRSQRFNRGLTGNTNRAECVRGISHCLPAVAGSALGVRGVFASLFDQRPSPQKRRQDARTCRAGCAHSKSHATAGRNTTHENLRKLPKLLSTQVRISPIPRLSFRAKSPAKPELYAKVWRNLSILFPILPLGHSHTITAAWRFFFAALELEHHVLNA